MAHVIVPKPRKIVIINPGHGRKDPGCVPKENGEHIFYNEKMVTEREIVWEVSKHMKKEINDNSMETNLEAAISVQLMYGEDYEHDSPGERPDLAEKVKIPVKKLNEQGYDVVFHISLHCDCVENPSAEDATMYYWDPNDEKIARQILMKYGENVVMNGEQIFFGKRSQPVQQRGLKVLVTAKQLGVAAAYIELGFLSSPLDRKWLIDPECQKRMAWVLSSEIINIYADKAV
ncbi:N-acetylmuramoyl-L-alanine amidase [Candidatus Micrarchaeota archaeon]|jgi:N-acetylmuramoyl-L-alanine amidase|nr:N-acetylmuramoyl-L-alanine amidase [Candidatus Micrarchaeota archaeon]